MMIYLADGTRGKVFKFDYDGNSFEELLDSSFFPLSGMITPNAIYVDEDSIYIADSVFGLLQLQRNSTNGTRVSDSFELNVAYDLVSYNLGDNATGKASHHYIIDQGFTNSTLPPLNSVSGRPCRLQLKPTFSSCKIPVTMIRINSKLLPTY